MERRTCEKSSPSACALQGVPAAIPCCQNRSNTCVHRWFRALGLGFRVWGFKRGADGVP